MARSKEMDLTTGNPFRSLLKFAIPVILGNLFQLFYTLADSVIVGKTLGADSLAAVGSASIIIYFVFCFINGFTGGFGICLGQKCGAKDEKGMRKSVAVSTLLSIAFTVVLTLICCLLSHQILRWMQIPADISGEAYDYMFVVLLGTGATVFYNMISNMLRALGDSKTPLYFLVFSSVLNIFLDILFIVPFHMGGGRCCMGDYSVTVFFGSAESGSGIKKFPNPASAQRRFYRFKGYRNFAFKDRISYGIPDVCHVYRTACHAGSGKLTGYCSSCRIYRSIESRSAFCTGKQCNDDRNFQLCSSELWCRQMGPYPSGRARLPDPDRSI